MEFVLYRVSNYDSDSKNPKKPTNEFKLKEWKNDFGDTKWTIELNTLNDLLEFIDIEGKVILDRYSITIYDDYVE